MAPSWISPSHLFLILVLVYGATAQDQTPTLATPPNPGTFNNNSGVNTQSNETATNPPDADTTPSTATTVHITETMENHTTTLSIKSIMSERDSFHEERDRLRVAVIILGIFFALAAVAIIIGLVWFFIIRKRSGTLKSEHQAQKRTTAGQKIETPQHNLRKTQTKDNSANLDAKQKTDNTVKHQGKEPSKSNSSSTASISGDYECQSNSSDKVQPKGPPAIPKTGLGFYANTSSDRVQSVGNTGADEQEVYIELDEEKVKSDTSADKMPARPSSSQRDSSTDEIYENFTPETLQNYSQLDTENQYDHQYA